MVGGARESQHDSIGGLCARRAGRRVGLPSGRADQYQPASARVEGPKRTRGLLGLKQAEFTSALAESQAEKCHLARGAELTTAFWNPPVPASE
jgi:hypothetical protein